LARYWICQTCGWKIRTSRDLEDGDYNYPPPYCPECDNDWWYELVTDGDEIRKEKAKERIDERED